MGATPYQDLDWPRFSPLILDFWSRRKVHMSHREGGNRKIGGEGRGEGRGEERERGRGRGQRKVEMEKRAPAGSRRAALRPAGLSRGGTRMVPPSSAARAAVPSASSTAK